MSVNLIVCLCTQKQKQESNDNHPQNFIDIGPLSACVDKAKSWNLRNSTKQNTKHASQREAQTKKSKQKRKTQNASMNKYK